MTDISDIKKSEKEKDYLLKEITHRVKNNLAMVSSLVRIKGSTLGPEADLTDLVNQIDAVRIVHEKLNKRDGISDIDIHDYFEEILSTVFSFKAGISYQNSVTRINVSPRTAVPLGLILNEAATNTVKYAFPEKNKGIFSVKLNQDKAEAVYILTLGNDGCPIPESIDIENPETMGFRLIYALTSQLEGTMEVIRSPRPLMIFRFPAEVFEQTSL
jgi:two-component sensor histidine kinase